ncbi:MAG: hypothetical protein ACRDCW_04215 [Sarcina sp.]
MNFIKITLSEWRKVIKILSKEKRSVKVIKTNGDILNVVIFICIIFGLFIASYLLCEYGF